MQKITKLAIGVSAFLPALSFAQTGGSSLLSVLGLISKLINGIIPILLALAVLAFFWGLIQYLFANGSEADIAKGLKMMTAGIIAIFVMVSLWGIIRVLQRSFGVTDPRPIVPRAIQRTYNGL